MGILHYDHRSFEFEDRLLTHIQIVVGLKLRRSECFYLSWVPGRDSGSGRRSVWISNAVPLCFEFSGSKVEAVNREWIASLVKESGGGIGLNLSDARNREPLLPPRSKVRVGGTVSTSTRPAQGGGLPGE